MGLHRHPAEVGDQAAPPPAALPELAGRWSVLHRSRNRVQRLQGRAGRQLLLQHPMEFGGKCIERGVRIHRHRGVHTDAQQAHQVPGQGRIGQLAQVHHGGGRRLRGQHPIRHQGLQEGGMEGGIEAQPPLPGPRQHSRAGFGAELLQPIAGAESPILPISQGGHIANPMTRAGEGTVQLRGVVIPVGQGSRTGGRGIRREPYKQLLHQRHGREAISDGVVEGKQQLAAVVPRQPGDPPKRRSAAAETLAQVCHGGGLPGLGGGVVIPIPRPGQQLHRDAGSGFRKVAVVALPDQGAAQQQMLLLQGNQRPPQGRDLETTAIAGDHREVHVAGTAGIQQTLGALKHIHGCVSRSRPHRR